MKAYVIHPRDDDDQSGSYVVYAATARAARRGAHIDDVEWIDLRVRRAPEFDRFAPNGPNVRELLEAGWYHRCGSCDRHVGQDDDDAVVTDNDAYCNENCHAHDAGWSAGFRFAANERNAIEREAQLRWPDADVCYVLWNRPGWGEPFPADGFRLYVHLKFHGDGHYATWWAGDREPKRDGPWDPT